MPSRRILSVFLLGGLLGYGLSLPNTTHAQVSYQIMRLGGLGPGKGANGYALNNRGEVVGISSTGVPGEGTRGFRTSPNSPINPLTDNLGVFSNYPGYESKAWGINDRGQVVGDSYIFLNGMSNPATAFRVNQGQKIGDPGTYLGTFEPDGFSLAYDINNRGQVTGASSVGLGYHPYRTSPDGYITPESDLGTLGDSAYGLGINNLGQVAGWAVTPDDHTHAFLTSPTGKVSDPGADLGLFLGGSTQARDVNDWGQVVGTYLAPEGRIQGFFWEQGQYTSIGKPGSKTYPTAINNLGQVVGYTNEPVPDQPGWYYRKVFLWEKGEMLYLHEGLPSDAGWGLALVEDINDLGQIVGTGFAPDGSVQGFLLTPLPASVPEPGGWVFLLAGGGVVGGVCWWRWRTS